MTSSGFTVAAEQAVISEEPQITRLGHCDLRYGRHSHGGGDSPYSAAGCAFLKFISSPDGLDWQKVPFKNDSGVPEVFIPNGSEGGNGGRNDGGYMTEFSNPPLRIGDELAIYYGASSYGKNHPGDVRVSGGGIFQSRLWPDGFVSVDGGSLTTKAAGVRGAGAVR